MDARARHTWGRHGFAAAAVTGGMIGISGRGVAGVATPTRPAGVGAASARYGVPDSQAVVNSSEFRLAEIADRPDLGQPGAAEAPAFPPRGEGDRTRGEAGFRPPGTNGHRPPDADGYRAPADGPGAGRFGPPTGAPPRDPGPAPDQAGPEQARYPADGAQGGSAEPAGPWHGTPNQGFGPDQPPGPNRPEMNLPGPAQPAISRPAANPSAGLAVTESTVSLGGVERTDAMTSAQADGAIGAGSDGFLAGNAAALAHAPSHPMNGSTAGALGPGEGSLGTGFGAYGAPPEVDANRPGSRHARPEPADLFKDGSTGADGATTAVASVPPAPAGPPAQSPPPAGGRHAGPRGDYLGPMGPAVPARPGGPAQPPGPAQSPGSARSVAHGQAPRRMRSLGQVPPGPARQPAPPWPVSQANTGGSVHGPAQSPGQGQQPGLAAFPGQAQPHGPEQPAGQAQQHGQGQQQASAQPAGPAQSSGPVQPHGQAQHHGSAQAHGPAQSYGPVRSPGPAQSQGPVQPSGPARPQGQAHGPVQPSGPVQPNGQAQQHGPARSYGPAQPPGQAQSQGQAQPHGQVQRHGPGQQPAPEQDQPNGQGHGRAQGTPGGAPGRLADSETSALGSLDSSGLFGSLSSPPR